MRLLAAVIAAVCCFAVPAQGEEAPHVQPHASDAIGLMLDDPIGLLLEDPIELLLRAQVYRDGPAPRKVPEIPFEVAAMDVDVLATMNTGGPVAPPPRRVRFVRPAELAARAYEPNYAKSWGTASAAPRSPDVEPPPRVVFDGDIALKVNYR